MNRLRLATSVRGVLLLSASLGICGRPSRGEEPAEAPPTAAEKTHLRAAEKHMRGLGLRRRDADADAIGLIDRPLLSFGDPARMHQRGSFWAWGRTGRPTVFLELWQDADQPELWRHSVTLSSAERLSLNAGPSGRWTPPQTPLETPLIADGPAPAKEEMPRLRQLKQQACRFTAHEFWDPDKLRLLTQPVHRYSDAKMRLQDAAVFILAHGTNPEVVLLIEAQGEAVESSRWHYALIPTSSAELHVELDGKEVWRRGRVPNVAGSPIESYWIFRLPVETEP
ncbi:MAG TPA: hypothetical protein PK867_15265 [Pirellulales bacterium]|nr:hypothetical protein [Pirellulales bacterium]